MTIKIIDCEQGSPEWFAARLGIPTASMFSAILAKGEGKTRRSYMLKLAAQIVTGDPGEDFSSAAMERGKKMEAEACDLYALMFDADLVQVGFVRNGPVGWSPDRLIGSGGALEVKTQRADLLIDTILKDEMPPEHKAQCQGGLWVGEREWTDLFVYWPKMPPLVKRVRPDRPYIANLAGEVDRFRAELATLVDRVRRYGMAEAA